MKEPFVITISREVGSGGRTIGRKLAEKLGVRFSDKELVDALQKKLNLTVSGIEELKGKKKRWMDDFIQMVAPVPMSGMLVDGDSDYINEYNLSLSVNDVFEAEREILKGIADEGSCVIAGRSGFFVLKGRPNKVDILITASREKRIARIMSKQDLTRDKAEQVIEIVDKARDNYVLRYTGQSRYDARNYHIVINMDYITEDQAVDMILSYLGR
ncbi:MAG: cytidylate kinase-like family protein [Bacteroidaceae bacterium]|nr:cytidylate kinase-like family protein [Bacteroidaceae bacterium]MBO7588696.1 cytidylate kinase-like family protein [Bacteroidaceae bacterium]